MPEVTNLLGFHHFIRRRSLESTLLSIEPPRQN